MLDGFSYLLTQVGALLVASALLGVLAGHYLWPRRTARTEPAAVAGARSPAGAATDAGAAGASPPVPGGPPRLPGLPGLPGLAGLPTLPAGPADPGGPSLFTPTIPDTYAPVVDPAVADLERRLRSSRSEVVKLQAEALRLREAVAAVADSKDAEMGRLESAAIEALDSLISSHQLRMTALEEEAAAAEAAARRHEGDLEEERRRALRLQAALAERDERIAALQSQLPRNTPR